MTRIVNIVENGTAPDERFPQMKKLRIRETPQTMDGYSVAVCEQSHSVEERMQ